MNESSPNTNTVDDAYQSDFKERWTGRALRVAICCLLLFLSACQSYTDRTQHLTGQWTAGRAELAAEGFSAEAKKAKGGRDELLLSLEAGNAWRAVGDFDASEASFARADALIAEWENRADVLLSREATSILSNQAARPYRGRAYDKVMLSTYRALNAMALGNSEHARIHLNRALERQREAVHENARRIEAALEQQRLAGQGRLTVDDDTRIQRYDMDRALRDPRLTRNFESHLSQVAERDLAPYADYVNPFTVFLDGLFFLYAAGDAADLERARVSFRRVTEMTRHSEVPEDARRAELAASGENLAPAVYVLFETGRAATRDEARIDIPLFLLSDQVSYVGAAFPQLRFYPDGGGRIEVQSNGELFQTEVLCSMDSVIAREFRNEWPSIMTRTLLAAASKALGAYALERSLDDQGELVRLLARVAVIGYQFAVNRADVRAWTTLPKEFQYARAPVPENGELVLRARGETHTITIEPDPVTVVYVQSVSPRAPLRIHKFTLP